MNNDFEVSILEEYLPTMFSDDEIKTIKKRLLRTIPSLHGKIWGVMVELKNHPKSAQIDKKIANRFVREILK